MIIKPTDKKKYIITFVTKNKAKTIFDVELTDTNYSIGYVLRQNQEQIDFVPTHVIIQEQDTDNFQVKSVIISTRPTYDSTLETITSTEKAISYIWEKCD